MTDKVKAIITKLSEKAVVSFIAYDNACQKIAKLLEKETEEHVDVLYQSSDGLVVCVDKDGMAPDNIPIEEYLKELKK